MRSTIALVYIPVEIVYCTAPVEVLQQRLRDRAAANNDIADATVELLASQQAAFEDFTPEELALVRQS
jgi:predicted kinase